MKMSNPTSVCDDILAFEELLRNSRKLDDNIIHALNTTVQTQSFSNKNDATQTCKDLYVQLEDLYESRQSSIQNCIQLSKDRLQILKTAKAKSAEDSDCSKALRKEQSQFRLLQSELGVEEIIKRRSRKAFLERCRWFYNPA